MCLLHTHHADTKLSDAWIDDFYAHNSDGIGIMYSEADENGVLQLHVRKYLPRDGADAIKFYTENIKGRECLVHWRMATHGDVDLHNCHPYEITPLGSDHPVWMMHNGILHTGNALDRTKSDTWHYIDLYLKPLLDPAKGGNPDLAFNDAFKHILGDAIGNGNRFAFMNAEGKTMIINEDTGVHWNGMWLSNTYAWTAPSRLSASKYSKKANKYYEAAQQGENTEWMEEPDYWYETYKDSKKGSTGSTALTHWSQKGNEVTRTHTTTGVTGGNGTVITGTNAIGGGKKNKRAKHKKNALVPVTPIGTAAKVDTPMDTFIGDQIDEMFILMDDEGCRTAYKEVNFADVFHFIKTHSLDICWDAVYMMIDGVITEESFMDYVKHPAKWDHADRPRTPNETKVNVASGDASIPVEVMGMDEEDYEYSFQQELEEEQRLLNLRVIEATQPTNPYKQLVSQDTADFAQAAADQMAARIFDQRSSSL